MNRENMHWFYYVSRGVLLLFFGIMIYVTIIAFGRNTGSMGIDMSKIHEKRLEQSKQIGDVTPP